MTCRLCPEIRRTGDRCHDIDRHRHHYVGWPSNGFLECRIESKSRSSFFLACLGIAWLYLVPVKRSKFGTVAYRLLDMRILTIKGQRPSLFIMTLRLVIAIGWPFGLADFVWIGVDSERRSIHDCYAGTCVVRRSAKPLGIGPMHLTYYCGAGMTLVYPRVVRLAVT